MCSSDLIQRDKNGKVLSMAWFGLEGQAVAGPSGYHRIEKSTDGKMVRNFDTENRPIRSPGRYTLIPLLYIREIIDMHQPAAKVGLCAGDVLWIYGSWSFQTALAAEQAKGTKNDNILAAYQSFLNEIKRHSRERTSMTVLRNGKPIAIVVPPLPGQMLGMNISDRRIPVAIFERWKGVISSQKTGPL